MRSDPESEQPPDWVTIRMPDVESAGSLGRAFGSTWGQRGVSVIPPDYFDFHIALQPPGKTLRAALGIVRDWLRENARESVVVESEGHRYTVDPAGALPATNEPDETDKPEIPTGRHLLATLEFEDVTDDGQEVGPVRVWDTIAKRLVWQSEEWVRESDFVALCERYGWQPEFDR